ncbi:uncharacterized protein ACRADG_010672 isoform 2-T2 [Cochliomyia hominivorax]
MKCCSHHTFGVIIGSLYLMICIFVFIVMTTSLIENSLKEEEDDYVKPNDSREITKDMIKCFIVQITSVLLIWGIVKRRPYFMIPWLIICVIIFICSFYILLLFYFILPYPRFPSLTLVTFAIILQMLIYIFMCNLFGIIKMENKQNPPIIIQDNAEVTYEAIERK